MGRGLVATLLCVTVVAALGSSNQNCASMAPHGMQCVDVPPCASGRTAVAGDFMVSNSAEDEPARQQTAVHICHSPEGIRIAANATEDHIFSPWTHCNDPVFQSSDVLENFVAPVWKLTDNPEWYHEVDVGAAGAVWAGVIDNPKGNASDCKNCTAGNLPCSGMADFGPDGPQAYAINGTGWWGTEVLLPWSLFPAEFREHGLWPLWRLNFYRYDYPDGPSSAYELSAWSPTHDPSFHVPARFGAAVMVHDALID